MWLLLAFGGSGAGSQAAGEGQSPEARKLADTGGARPGGDMLLGLNYLSNDSLHTHLTANSLLWPLTHCSLNMYIRIPTTDVQGALG